MLCVQSAENSRACDDGRAWVHAELRVDAKIAKGFGGRRGYALPRGRRGSRMFRALADVGVNMQMISTSEIKISVVIEEEFPGAGGAYLAFTAFELDAEPDSHVGC